MDYFMDNELCEICWAYEEPEKICTFDVYWINHHCIELRRNREARNNKNTIPRETVF